MKNIILLLRGHERDAFETNQLNEFVNMLKKSFLDYEIIVYVHTWSKTEASRSWRPLHKIPRNLSESNIREYFDTQIHNISIEDENNSEIIGNVNGKFGSMPLVCWKKMWYGQFKAIETISSDFSQSWDEPIVINMRIDFFDCFTTKKYKLTEKMVINRIRVACQNTRNIVFMKDSGEFDGIDNIIVSTLNHMYMLLHHFYHNLDAIILRYEYLFFHENSVYYEAQKITGNQDSERTRLQYLGSVAWNHFKAFSNM